MKNILTRAALLLGFLCFPVSDAVAGDVYQLDPVHSAVVFKVKHLGCSYTYGLAPNLEGEFTYDPEDPGSCSISVTVPAPDITTEHAERDKHVLSEELLNAAKYPTMTFQSTGVKTSAGNRCEVSGNLTIMGVTRAVTFQAELVGCIDDERAGSRCGFDAQFTIKRSDFGFTAFLPAIGDEVTLMIGIEGVKQQ
ncbi:MAG: polyisoprenoid-binding protein [Candidatus Hydrogenedentes bacterium]|nr:polyisoprenoid-binding protein [Candidatus Hydrogenedentota bacterium]